MELMESSQNKKYLAKVISSHTYIFLVTSRLEKDAGGQIMRTLGL